MQSLIIVELHLYEILLRLLDECQHLPNLILLSFRSCYFFNSPADYQLIINKIWSLPKLTTCYINISINIKHPPCIPTIVSTSIKTLELCLTEFQWNDINRLIECTPYMESLSEIVPTFSDYSYSIVTFPRLIKFHSYFRDKYNLSNLNFVFQSMPNLHHLDISISFTINGHQWENIIRNYLPKLQIFRLLMQEYFYLDENIQQKTDELYNSFSTSFWINE